MSVPRLLLVPTHRTGVADAIASAVTDILTAQGREVRYHHVGPAPPLSAWDRSGGSVFVDPSITDEATLIDLYDVAVRHADLSLLSSTAGLLDKTDGAGFAPVDLARLLDCPVVVVLDCRGWGASLKLLTAGLKIHLRSLNLAGVILSGVADKDHLRLLKKVLGEDDIRVAGCLFSGQGLDWDTQAPGAWGVPLSAEVVEAVAKHVDVSALSVLAGERGFLAKSHRLADHGKEGPVVLVAGGEGFTPWSRDSIEVLRAAGAQVRRLDLLQEATLPPDAAGLVLAGSLWPESIQDIAMNTTLMRDIATKVGGGLPTIALGGGMLVLLTRVQDTLGRTSDLAGVIPAQAEILWDAEEPTYVELECVRDNLLLAEGEKVTGWAFSEVEFTQADITWGSPLRSRRVGENRERHEAHGSESLLASPVMLHIAATRGAAGRFVAKCKAYAEGAREPLPGSSAASE